MKPIKVYQCKKKCCAKQIHSRRFWHVRTPKCRETFSHFPMAASYAAYEASRLPLEVTA